MNLNLVYLIPFMLYVIFFAFTNDKTDNGNRGIGNSRRPKKG